MNGPDVEGVLGRHLIGYESRAYPSHVCLCGWDGAQGDDGSESDGQNDNAEAATAHVAAAVRAEVRAWLESGPIQALADQWNDTPDYMPSAYDQGRVDQRHDMTTQLLEVLAALVASSRVPGEES